MNSITKFIDSILCIIAFNFLEISIVMLLILMLILWFKFNKNKKKFILFRNNIYSNSNGILVQKHKYYAYV